MYFPALDSIFGLIQECEGGQDIVSLLAGPMCHAGFKRLNGYHEATVDIVIRADASRTIGTGHIVRCLTLAEILRNRGASVTFICRLHHGHLCDQIEQRGFRLARLSSNVFPEAESTHAGSLGATWQVDAEQTSTGIAIIDAKPAWLVIDHYALDNRWERALRPSVGRICVIDDLADRSHDCDLLLDQNLEHTVVDHWPLVPASCTLLVGPKHALLRPEFTAMRTCRLQRDISPRLQKILVSMGGVDRSNATGYTLNALKTCQLPEDCVITVVMGRLAPWLKEVTSIAENMPWQTEVLVDVTNMAQLMTVADCAVSAGGLTSYELAYMGVPAILLPATAVQAPVSAGLARHGAAINLGLAEEFPLEGFLEAVRVLDASAEKRQEMIRIGQALFDGRGAERVGEAMLGSVVWR